MYNKYYDNEMFFLFDHIENQAAFNEAMKMWYEDIMSMKATKIDILSGANSLIEYWGSDSAIVDVAYDEVKKCHVWTVCDGF